MIKVQNKRATIFPEFVEASKDIARAKVLAFKEQITSMGNASMREHLAKRNVGLLLNAGKMISDPKSWDDILTRLRCLEYTQFDVVTAEAYKFTGTGNTCVQTFLHGTTKPVTIRHAGGHSLAAGSYDMGPYDIYLQVSELKHDGYRNFHFVPQYSPMTWNRHVHHTATERDFSTTPLTMSPSTCWGGFPTIVQTEIVDFDIVELFRTIWTYLNRYNPGSPLCRLSSIQWKKVL
jgi:hypothetical protein